jgi:hypothetical protein
MDRERRAAADDFFGLREGEEPKEVMKDAQAGNSPLSKALAIIDCPPRTVVFPLI